MYPKIMVSRKPSLVPDGGEELLVGQLRLRAGLLVPGFNRVGSGRQVRNLHSIPIRRTGTRLTGHLQHQVTQISLGLAGIGVVFAGEPVLRWYQGLLGG